MRIPLYNKGLGPTVELAAGQSGPRASQATFTAASRAQAQFADQAGQIAFQFGMAEKKRETDRVANEEATRIQGEADDFLLNNQDTETAVFTENFTKFQNDQLNKINALPNLTTQQKADVASRASRLMAGKLAAGKQNTFNRGQARASDAANESIAANIAEMGTLAPSDPRYQELFTQNVEEINKGVANGLKINYTQTSMQLAVTSRNYFNKIQAATSTGDLDTIKEELKADTTLPTKAYQALLGNVAAQKNVIKGQNLDAAKGDLAGIAEAATPEQLDQIASAYLSGTQITVSIGGEDVTIDPTTLSESARLQMAGLSIKFENAAVGELVDNLAGRISEISDDTTRASLEQASQDAADGKNFTITRTNGEVEEFDISQLPNGKKIEIAGALRTAAGELQDITSREVVSGMNDVLSADMSMEDALSTFQGFYRPEILANKSLKPEQVDSLVYSSASISVDGVSRKLTEGDLSNVPEMLRRLDTAEALLTQDLNGRGSLQNNVDSSLASTTSTTLNAISRARYEINKKINETAKFSVGVKQLQSGTFRADMFTPGDASKMVAATISLLDQQAADTNQNSMSMKFSMLEKNNVVHEVYKNQLGKASSLGRSGVLEAGTADFETVQRGLNFYNAMKRYPAVLQNHTTKEDRTFFESINARLGFETLDSAIVNVSRAAFNDVKISDVTNKKIEQAAADVMDRAKPGFIGSMFVDGPTEVQNGPEIQTLLERRVKDYVKLNVNVENAIELAKKDIAETHVFVRGILTRKQANTPPNINQLANLAVEQALRFRDEQKIGVPIISDDDLEADDLSLVEVPSPGSGVWALMSLGGVNVPAVMMTQDGDQFAIDDKRTVTTTDVVGMITWTTRELEKLASVDQGLADQARLNEINQDVKDTAANIAVGVITEQQMALAKPYMFGDVVTIMPSDVEAAEAIIAEQTEDARGERIIRELLEITASAAPMPTISAQVP